MLFSDIKYCILRVMHFSFLVLICLIAQCTFMDHLKLLLFVFVFTSTTFDVFSTVHHSIELFHQPTSMHNSLFINNMYVTLLSSTCFEQSALNRCTVQPFTESDDTRCCVNTIFPPEDGHVNARNMSRIIV